MPRNNLARKNIRFRDSDRNDGGALSRSRSTKTSRPITSSNRMCWSTVRASVESSQWTEEGNPQADDVRPVLQPFARTWTDDEAVVRFSLPSAEPIVERHPGSLSCGGAAVRWLCRRTRRPLAVDPGDGWDEHGCGDPVRACRKRAPVAARMLAALAATGAIDVSGRAVGRFLHRATKKGVLPAGGLEGDAVLRLATDGNYRAYPETPRIAVSQIGPRSAPHVPRADPLAAILPRLRRPRPAPERFRCAAPHRVRSDRGDALGGT